MGGAAPPATVAAGLYRLGPKLGAGSFGEIFLGALGPAGLHRECHLVR